MDRRTLLIGGASFWAAALLPAAPAGAQEINPVDKLLSLDDGPVHDAVRAAFNSNLRAAFFSEPGEYTNPYAVYYGASVLITALALGSISSHGFSGAVDSKQAAAQLAALLDPGNADFTAITRNLYRIFFGDRSKSAFGSFRNIIEALPGGSLVMYRALGGALADTLTSAPYITTQTAVYQAAPANFLQRMHMYIHMVTLLAPERVAEVRGVWQPIIHIDNDPWNTYQGLLAANYSSETFLPEVAAAVNTSRVTGQHRGETFCRGGPAASCYTQRGPDAHIYGETVAQWIADRQAAFPGVFTGAALSNTD